MTPAAAMTGTAPGGDPFSRRTVFALVALGSLLFLALLWLIGTGLGSGSTNDGGSHVGGRGLNGYAALAQYLDARGFAVRASRNKADLARPGLLVLTPPAGASGREIAAIVKHHRHLGPTIVIAPKWTVSDAAKVRGARKSPAGWVYLGGLSAPSWPGFLDQIGVSLGSAKPGSRWSARIGAGTVSAPLPDPRAIEAGAGAGMVRLVAGPGGKQTLAGFLDDGSAPPALQAMGMDRVLHGQRVRGLYPLVLVFEPDLLDNYGMARLENAQLAEALVRASGIGPRGAVTFDLTLNGFGGTRNLLTLAFRPPFLAATICLLMAAGLIAWRALLRFGPARSAQPAMAFGKQALVENTAGMIRRSRRWHLLAGPYVARERRRIAADLGLRTSDAETTGAMIDAVLRARGEYDADASETIADGPFSQAARALEDAQGGIRIVSAARALHALERTPEQ